MLNDEVLRRWPFAEVVSTYNEDDCIRYALSVGIASNPLDEDDLRYVVEPDLQVLPTFLATLGAPGAWASHPDTGIDWIKILHGEHRMRFFQALCARGVLRSRTRVTGLLDKGEGKGALVTTTRDVSDARSGQLLAQIEHVSFCRADGGYSRNRGSSDAVLAPLPAVPARAANAHMEMPTPKNAALLYRLNGDRNPIHAVPSAWREAGFEQPVLHGLCTYGMAAQALVKLAGEGNAARLGSLAARFCAPVYPGETLVLSLWHGDDTECGQSLYFEVHAKERGIKVLSHGAAEVKAHPLPLAGSVGA